MGGISLMHFQFEADGDGGSSVQLYAKECSKLLLHVLKRGPSKKDDEVVTSIGDEKEEDDILREQIGVHGTENWETIASKFVDKTTIVTSGSLPVSPMRLIQGEEDSNIPINCKVDSYHCQLIIMEISVVVFGIVWGVSGALVKAEFNNGGNVAKLWFACMVEL
ncbi:hypothetical protein JHK86_042811 [Glycine max]|nr:hypothetical protein JHK86_042811 [Glycine max]